MREAELRLVRKKKVESRKRGKNASDAERAKNYRKLEDFGTAMYEVQGLGSSNKRILVAIYQLQGNDIATPKMNILEAAEHCELGEANFVKSMSRLYKKALVDKVSPKTKSRGVLYWLHPQIKKILNILKQDEPTYFDI